MIPRVRSRIAAAAGCVWLLGTMWVFAGAACSSSAPGSPEDPGAAQASQAQPDSQPGDGDAAQPGEDPASVLTREDCDALIDHIVELQLREQRRDHPDLPPPAKEDLKVVRDQLAGELEGRCVGLKRGLYDCAMRADTREEIAACETPPE